LQETSKKVGGTHSETADFNTESRIGATLPDTRVTQCPGARVAGDTAS